MPTLRYLEHEPSVSSDVMLADSAYVIGRTTVQGPALLRGDAILRGDQATIHAGPRFHLGNRSTVHVDNQNSTHIGSNVWVGDDAVVHGCTVGEGTRLEDGALILSGSRVGRDCVVERGSLVPEGAEFSDNSYIAGTPGRRLRDTTPEERAATQRLLDHAFGLP